MSGRPDRRGDEDLDPRRLRRECIRMTDRTMPINFRIAAARQIEAYILGRTPGADEPARGD